MAIVSQTITLFNDTIERNIAYGALSDKTASDVEQATRDAQAWDFIQEFDQGLATEVGDNGVLLSGGQRQRLAIARALLKNAPVLILDEATSALDTESERAIQTALEQVVKGRTTIVIAHRLSTIEKADRILVLDNGEIKEQGTHQELLQLGERYAQFYQVNDTEAALEPPPQAAIAAATIGLSSDQRQEDAEASCRSSSSSRRMIRITEPSKASVKFITSMNLAPEAHSYLFGSVCEHLVSVFGVNEFVMCASDEYLCACVFGVEERL